MEIYTGVRVTYDVCRQGTLFLLSADQLPIHSISIRDDTFVEQREIMSHYAITLPVPDYIYDRARQVAEDTSQSIEDVLVRQLENAFTEPLPALEPEEQRELEALAFLSDDALCTIAREHMPEDRQARLHVLMTANSQGAVDEIQRAELEALVVQGQRLSLRKAQAAALLTERGYAVSSDELSAADE